MTDQMTTTYFRCHEALERLDRYVGAWIVVTGGDSPGDLAIKPIKAPRQKRLELSKFFNGFSGKYPRLSRPFGLWMRSEPLE